MQEKQHNELNDKPNKFDEHLKDDNIGNCQLCGDKGYKTNGDGHTRCKRCSGESPAKKDTTLVRAHKKIGRNQPCPCGSGNKYKRCCGLRYKYN